MPQNSPGYSRNNDATPWLFEDVPRRAHKAIAMQSPWQDMAVQRPRDQGTPEGARCGEEKKHYYQAVPTSKLTAHES